MKTIIQPIIVVGAPRSGTTLLYSILSSHPDLWSIYAESEWIINRYFSPKHFDWQRGNELNEKDATRQIRESMRLDFYWSANNYQFIFRNSYSKVYTNRKRERFIRIIHKYLLSPLFKPSQIRFVEKNPKNCLRISFMDTVFPDSFFVFLVRDPRANISSLMEGWLGEGKYHTYAVPNGLEIDSYSGKKWNFLLPAGWEKFTKGVRLEEVCAFQYREANQKAVEDLEQISNNRKLLVHYEDLVAFPERTVQHICEKANLTYTGGLKRMAKEMPVVNSKRAPNKDKWRVNENRILSVIGDVQTVAARIGYSL